MAKIDKFLANAIQKHSKNGSSHLGDRNDYIGASDIAGCPRKAVMARRDPKPHSFATLMRFAWGHAAQALFRDIFISGGMKPGEDFNEEVELVHPGNPRIKCHIDFLFESPWRFHVVEKKATRNLPDNAYSSWDNQVHFQMGMLKLDPRSQGKRIGGSVLATEPLPRDDEENEQPGYKEYNGYEPDDIIFAHLMKKGEHILRCIDGEEEPECEPSLLCGTCDYNKDCPTRKAINVNIPSEIIDVAAKHDQLSKQKKELDVQLEILKQRITDFTGKSFAGECNGTILEVQDCEGRLYADTGVLRSKYPHAYKASIRRSKGWTKITVRKVDAANSATSQLELPTAA